MIHSETSMQFNPPLVYSHMTVFRVTPPHTNTHSPQMPLFDSPPHSMSKQSAKIKMQAPFIPLYQVQLRETPLQSILLLPSSPLESF